MRAIRPAHCGVQSLPALFVVFPLSAVMYFYCPVPKTADADPYFVFEQCCIEPWVETPIDVTLQCEENPEGNPIEGTSCQVEEGEPDPGRFACGGNVYDILHNGGCSNECTVLPPADPTNCCVDDYDENVPITQFIWSTRCEDLGDWTVGEVICPAECKKTYLDHVGSLVEQTCTDGKRYQHYEGSWTNCYVPF